MKNLFKLFTILFVVAALTSCGSKRPETNENFQISISGTSILKNAEVALYSDGKEVATTTTDENGAFELSEVESATGLNISVCKGAFHSVAADSDVSFTGCLNHYIPQTQESVSVVVDFLSTFITKYNEIIEEKTALEEWSEYLSMTTSPAPELQSSLTDATKRYLWQQGISKIAENVSKANGVTPESMYSTENLFNMLVADLTDDAVINGSTNAKFGTLNIEASILKSVLADAIPEVSETFSAADLSEWTDKIRYSDAKFLGGTGAGIDSEKPIITINEPKADEILFGTVSVSAEATDNVQIKSFVCALVGENMPKLEDTSDDVSLFNAEFNSALIPDGTHSVKCTASDGTNIVEAERSFKVSNSNKVALKAYITNPLVDWDSVTVYDENDSKVQSLSFEASEDPEILLAPGTYRIVFAGGYYNPVFLPEESIKFDSKLETRVSVKAGENATAYATPITTLREHLLRALRTTPIEKVDEKSFELISEHIDRDFPIYIEPLSKNQLTENSKYYFVLAALERLAVLVGERHEPQLEKGSITIEQVLKALTDDLAAEDAAVLDGKGKINQFPVDSYLFRYWYAIALKLFIESEENETGLMFSTFQTVIYNISMDESELFPPLEKPLKVTDKPPVISEKQFKRSFENEFQTYSATNIIYSNDDVFSLKFKAAPDESGDLFLDSVDVSGDAAELAAIKREEDSDIYSTEMKLAGEDGTKSLLITAIDNAENKGTATLQAVKDTIAPDIISLGEELPDYVKAPLKVAYTVAEENPLNTFFALTVGTTEPTAADWKTAPALLQGEIAVAEDMISENYGAYTVFLKALDKAGNTTTRSKALVIDNAAPSISYISTPEINANGFINDKNMVVTIIAEDNITPQEQLIYEVFATTEWIENIEAVKNIFNVSCIDGGTYQKRYRVKDLAGNISEELQLNFTVDETSPVITTNKTFLESRAFRTADETLVLNTACSDENRDSFGYSIDGENETAIEEENISLANNELLTEGSHIVTVICRDKAGNESSETINLVIDNTPPTNLAATLKSGTVCTLNKTYSVSAEDTHSVTKFKYRYKIPNESSSATYTANASNNKAEFIIPNSNDSFYKDSTSQIYYNKVNEFTTYISAVDEAGNETDEILVSSQFDKQGVNSLSFIEVSNAGVINIRNPNAKPFKWSEYENANDKYQFLEDKFNETVGNDLKGVKVNINGTTIDLDYVHWDECATGDPCSGKSYSYFIYYYDENTVYPTLYLDVPNLGNKATVKVMFKDSCGNWGIDTDCSTTGQHSCIEYSFDNTKPSLFVDVTQKNVTQYELQIKSDGTITNCSIKGADGTTKSCSAKTGTQTISATGWKSQTYTVTVTAKLTSNGNTATTSKQFIVDNSAFVAPTISTTKEFFKQTSPVIQYNLGNIATGIKSAKFEVVGRKVNYKFASGSGWGDTDSNGFKTNSNYTKTIFTATSSTAKTGTQTIDLPGGIYNKIRYTITPNFGDTRTGDILLSEPIRYIDSANNNFKIKSSGNYKVEFMESIISKKLTNSDITISSNATFNEMCQKNGTDFIYNQKIRRCETTSSGTVCNDEYLATKTNFKRTTTINTSGYNNIVFTPYTKQYRFVNTSCDGLSQCSNASMCTEPKVTVSSFFCIPSSTLNYWGEDGAGTTPTCDCSKKIIGQGNTRLVPECCLNGWFKDITYIPATATIVFKEAESSWSRNVPYDLKNYIVTKAKTDCP